MLIDASVTPLPARKRQYNTDVCTRSQLTLQTIFLFFFVNRRLKMSGLHANEKFKVAFIDMGGVVGE